MNKETLKKLLYDREEEAIDSLPSDVFLGPISCIEYIAGFMNLGKVYESEVLDSKSDLFNQCVQFVDRDDIKKCVYQCWYYTLDNESIENETTVVKSDNERYRWLFDDDTDSSDDEKEPSMIVCYIVCVERDKGVNGGHIEFADNSNIIYMVKGASIEIDGTREYRFTPYIGSGEMTYIKFIFEINGKKKVE